MNLLDDWGVIHLRCDERSSNGWHCAWCEVPFEKGVTEILYPAMKDLRRSRRAVPTCVMCVAQEARCV